MLYVLQTIYMLLYTIVFSYGRQAAMHNHTKHCAVVKNNKRPKIFLTNALP